MQATYNADAEALLMEVHAARFLNLSVRTLQAWRIKGCGPAYVQAGRAIRYRRSDLLSWINDHVVTSAKTNVRMRGVS